MKLVGIDFRPRTGELYGVGSDSVVYRVNERTAIALGAAGPATAPFATTLAGGLFGVDFNPAADAIRIVSNADYNHRVSPNTGADGTGTPDAGLNPGDPYVTAAAYTNSAFSVTPPGSTTLYVIDPVTDTLYVQSPPNAGTLTSPVPISANLGPITNFDIAGTADTSARGGRHATIYALDLVTGTATSLGTAPATAC